MSLFVCHRSTPGVVGAGGGGSSYATSKKGYTPTMLCGKGCQPGGHDRFVPEATLSADWDLLGGIAGLGGLGSKEEVKDGHGGAVRIRLPGYFDMPLERIFKAPPARIDSGYDGEHPRGVRPAAAAVARVRHLLSNPKPTGD